MTKLCMQLAAALLLLGSPGVAQHAAARIASDIAPQVLGGWVTAVPPKPAALKTITLGKLNFTACSLPGLTDPFSQEEVIEPVEAYCSSLQVPENRDRPDGRKIDLKIAWVPPLGTDAVRPDPVFMLAGGPGQSAIESFSIGAAEFEPAREHRGVVLVDQRGTGGSGKLHCPDEGALMGVSSVPDDTYLAAARRCARQLSEKADLRFYTTAEAVDDLEAVRQAMGLGQINLLGISYGTRVAQQYARRFPQHVRTLVLDSPLPDTRGFGDVNAAVVEGSMTRLFSLCQKDAACRQRLGDPKSRLDKVMRRLKKSPVDTEYLEISTNTWKKMRFDEMSMASLVALFAYGPETAAMLPATIALADKGEFHVLATQVMALNDMLNRMIASGLYLSVMCSEDHESLNRVGAGKDFLLVNRSHRQNAELCRHWPRGGRGLELKTPLPANMPVITISGEFDPVIPTHFGDEVVRGLTNARAFLLKGQA
ncbi:MAG: alpha/beta fold hydrolase, partial [Lautropia sp.]|nr:alpha/beta fold hydrolase [Lautropia sp.]